MQTREVVATSGTRLLQVEVPSPNERAFGLAFRSELSDGHGLWLADVQSVDTTDFRFPVSVAFLRRGSIRRIIDMEPGSIEAVRSNEDTAVIVPQGWFERERITRNRILRLGSLS